MSICAGVERIRHRSSASIEVLGGCHNYPRWSNESSILRTEYLNICKRGQLIGFLKQECPVLNR